MAVSPPPFVSLFSRPPISPHVPPLACKKRFNSEEEAILCREVLAHWDELFGQRRHLLPRAGRGSIWNEVAATVRSSSGVAREGEEVRKKWYHFNNQLKAKLAVISASGGENGNPGPEALSELEAEVASKMKETTARRDAGRVAQGRCGSHNYYNLIIIITTTCSGSIHPCLLCFSSKVSLLN